MNLTLFEAKFYKIKALKIKFIDFNESNNKKQKS